jgi:hypothetical protein
MYSLDTGVGRMLSDDEIGDGYLGAQYGEY